MPGLASVVLGICLSVPISPEKQGDRGFVFIAGEHFTLAWTHSIEKQRWEEDYAVVATADGRLRLQPTAARIRGSGAGMEPPDGAVLRDGWYHYRPSTPAQDELRLARSGFTADYEWCVHRAEPRCRPLAELAPPPVAAAGLPITRLWPCRQARR